MKGGPSRQGRSERLLAFTYIGDLPLALDGAGISAIEAPGEDEGALDCSMCSACVVRFRQMSVGSLESAKARARGCCCWANGWS